MLDIERLFPFGYEINSVEMRDSTKNVLSPYLNVWYSFKKIRQTRSTYACNYAFGCGSHGTPRCEVVAPVVILLAVCPGLLKEIIKQYAKFVWFEKDGPE
jgi:hypothetical protein